MARTSLTQPQSQVTIEARFAHLESAVSNVATQLGDFIKESKDHRERIELEQSRIWTSIEKQSSNLQSAVEKLSSRGQLSWPVIMSTISLILVLVSAGATVSNIIMESRIKQIEIRVEAIREVREAHTRRLEESIEANTKLIDRHENSLDLLLRSNMKQP
jgi:hypothetical protein